jgi:hypothetical protein
MIMATVWTGLVRVIVKKVIKSIFRTMNAKSVVY